MLLNNYNQFRNRIPVTFKLKGDTPRFGLLVFGTYNQWYIWANAPFARKFYWDDKNMSLAHRMGLFDCLALGRSWVKGNKNVESIEYLGRFFTRHDSRWIQETARSSWGSWSNRDGRLVFSTTTSTPRDTFVGVSSSDPNNIPTISFNSDPAAQRELNHSSILSRRIRPMAGLRDLITRREN